MNLRKDHSQSLKSEIFLIVNLILFRMHIPDSEVNLGVRFVVTASFAHAFRVPRRFPLERLFVNYGFHNLYIS